MFSIHFTYEFYIIINFNYKNLCVPTNLDVVGKVNFNYIKT
jgi:hypothetical protein